jgi:hypothetical protein
MLNKKASPSICAFASTGGQSRNGRSKTFVVGAPSKLCCGVRLLPSVKKSAACTSVPSDLLNKIS